MEDNPIIQRVISCIQRLYVEDLELIGIEVGENTLNGRLAFYLRDEFEAGEIKVDVEYNRHIADFKEYDIYGHRAFVDILVHQRLTDEQNLIAFECKRDENDNIDVEKITALIGPYFGYQFGILVQYYPRNMIVYWMQDGDLQIEEITI